MQHAPTKALDNCISGTQQLLHYAQTHPLRPNTGVYGLEVRFGVIAPSKSNPAEQRFVPGVNSDTFCMGVEEFQSCRDWSTGGMGVFEQQQDTLFNHNAEVVCTTLRWKDAMCPEARGETPILATHKRPTGSASIGSRPKPLLRVSHTVKENVRWLDVRLGSGLGHSTADTAVRIRLFRQRSIPVAELPATVAGSSLRRTRVKHTRRFLMGDLWMFHFAKIWSGRTCMDADARLHLPPVFDMYFECLNPLNAIEHYGGDLLRTSKSILMKALNQVGTTAKQLRLVDSSMRRVSRQPSTPPVLKHRRLAVATATAAPAPASATSSPVHKRPRRAAAAKGEEARRVAESADREQQEQGAGDQADSNISRRSRSSCRSAKSSNSWQSSHTLHMV